jgi:hypothetical protein
VEKDMRLQRHQSRRTLLYALGAMVVVHVSVTLLVTRWTPWMREPDYGDKVHTLKALEARTPKRSLTVIAVGTSRTFNGLNAGLAESVLGEALGQRVTVCNFGINGAQFFTELLTVRRLLQDGHRPDFLLVEVMPVYLHSGWVSCDTGKDYAPDTSFRLSELKTLSHYAVNREEISQLDWALQWLSPVHTHRQNLLNVVAPILQPLAFRFRNNTRSADAWGWRALRREDWPESLFQRAFAASRETLGPPLKQWQAGGPSLELLTEILEVCRREHIPTAMFAMPEAPVFRSWYGPGCFDQSKAVLDDLGQRYGVAVIDARQWVDDDREYFDSHHLLSQGSETFTRRLAGEVLPALLNRYPGAHPGTSGQARLDRR